MSIVDALLPEFDHEMDATRRVLERLPQDRLDWKPHPRSFSLGQLGTHVAMLPVWATETVTRAEIDLTGDRGQSALPSTSEILGAFDANAAAARAALAGRTDPELLAVWSLKRNGRTLFTMPRTAVLRSFVMNHLIHHRAQLTVYLRLLDVPVPSLYGPSADESPF